MPYAPGYWPAPYPIEHVERPVDDLSGMVHAALDRVEKVSLTQDGKALQEIKYETREWIQTKGPKVRCLRTAQSYDGRPIDLTKELHQYGGRLLHLGGAVKGQHPWGPLNYNFYTVGNTYVYGSFSVHVEVRKCRNGQCAYYVEYSGSASFKDKFDFYPDKKILGSGAPLSNLAYDRLAFEWALPFNGILGAGRPNVLASWSDKWRESGLLQYLGEP